MMNHTHPHDACETAAVDPVCGMKVAPHKTQHRCEIAGKSFYFPRPVVALSSQPTRKSISLPSVATVAPEIFPAAFRGMEGSVAVYFEAAAVITVLVLLGQVLELRARESTSGAIKALLDLAPKTARRIRDDGSEEEVQLDRVDDRLRVRPGEKVASGRYRHRRAQFIGRVDGYRRVHAGHQRDRREGAGWPFFVRGWQSLLTRNLNMFTLIAMATGVAWV